MSTKKVNLDQCVTRPALFRGWDDSMENIKILLNLEDGQEYVLFEDNKLYSKSSFDGDPNCEIIELDWRVI